MKNKLALLTAVMLCAVCGQGVKALNLPAPNISNGITLKQALNQRKSDREYAAREVSDHDLSNILWCANGINRPSSGNRTAPSAMNFQDIKIYVVTKTGIWLYNAKQHALAPVATGNFVAQTGMQDFVTAAPLNLVYVADTSKYAERNTPPEAITAMTGMDAGFCAQNVYLYCAGAGLGTVFRASVKKDVLAKTLKLGEKEIIVAAQTIGYLK